MLGIALAFLSLSAFGQTLSDQEYEKLASSPAWLALMYYQRNLFGGYESEVDDDDFFISESGKHSPLAELKATIQAFYEPNLAADVPACRFPARYHWLGQHLNLPEFPQTTCVDLTAWKNQINAESVTLIFPAAYLDSPSSMFGHTLLRFDQKGQTKKNEILAYTANFAATKNPDDSEIEFAIRGLTGGYSGDVTVLPYYLKLKEYKDMESRDIWEYKLNFTTEETDQLLNVIWEAKDKRIDYYFFTENCAYRILSFLNSVRPEQQLMKPFRFHAIPLDTIRSVKKAGMVSEIKFRPSVRTKFDYEVGQLLPQERELIKNWVAGEAPLDGNKVADTPSGAVALLDTAFQYSRMSDNAEVDLRKLSFDILKARKNYTETSKLKPVPQPKYSDEFGHNSGKIGFVAGSYDKTNYVGLRLRAAYHDVLDPPLGYPRGASLIFGEIALRNYSNHKVEVEQLKLVSIASLKPRNQFFKPLSWAVQLGGVQFDYAGERKFAANLKGLLGPTYSLGKTTMLYAMTGGDLRVASFLKDNVQPYSYSELALTGNVAQLQWQVLTKAEFSLFESIERQYSVNIGVAWNLGQNATIGLTAIRQYLPSHNVLSGNVSLAFYL